MQKFKKYFNKIVKINNLKFDSVLEYKRYLYLKDFEEKGIISELTLQEPFVLQDSFKLEHVSIRAIKYLADFSYIYKDNKIVEDVKGFKTDVYKLKLKLLLYKLQQDNIKFLEVTLKASRWNIKKYY